MKSEVWPEQIVEIRETLAEKDENDDKEEVKRQSEGGLFEK